MTADSAARVYVVDDDGAVRSALKLLLSSAGLRAVAFASSQAFLEGYDGSQPGCLLLDVRMPGIGGLDLLERLRQGGPSLPIIILTGHGDVPMAVRALKQGAMDFIQKPFNDQVLLDRVQQALALDAENRRRHAGADVMRQREAQLTPREREVMQGIVAGKANKAVAVELGISERTVELHRARIMDKMGVRSLAALVEAAVGLRHTPADGNS
jgi:FixJ family two-component response regulator